MKNCFLIISLALFSIFCSCEKQEISVFETENDMRTRPPCYEIAIEGAISNNPNFKDALTKLIPLAEEAKIKGCFEEFKVFIMEIKLELTNVLTPTEIALIDAYYD